MAEETLPATVGASDMPKPTKTLLEQAYAAVMDGKLPPEVGDPQITTRAIQERIRSSERFDDVFRPSSLPSWTDYKDEVVIVGGFHLNPSTIEGQSVYAVVEIARAEWDGEFRPVSCGGSNVLTQLLKAWEQSWFPFKAKLVGKPTKGGFEALWLEAA